MNLSLDQDRPSLLLVDDDDAFRVVLAKALERRGFAVSIAENAERAMAMATQQSPEFAVVDLKMPGASGLALIERLIQLDAQTRIVMLTGYASIATAIEAIKLGAVHYLAKPVDADQVVAAFSRTSGVAAMAVTDQPLSVDRLEWEHIQRVLSENDNNVSATARALQMHRRTLQRKLGKRPTKE
jgi:two-component system response regulator RegA